MGEVVSEGGQANEKEKNICLEDTEALSPHLFSVETLPAILFFLILNFSTRFCPLLWICTLSQKHTHTACFSILFPKLGVSYLGPSQNAYLDVFVSFPKACSTVKSYSYVLKITVEMC